MSDREAIFDSIEADSPQAAVVMDDRIEARVERLRDTPEMGRLGRVAGTWELVISRTPYVAADRVESDRVRILRVLHGAQRWPDEMGDESEG